MMSPLVRGVDYDYTGVAEYLIEAIEAGRGVWNDEQWAKLIVTLHEMEDNIKEAGVIANG